MAMKFAQGRYIPKNTEKYIGKKYPLYRSSWELAFCRYCDENPAIIQWASESIRIKYRNPFKEPNRQITDYVPDFFIHYIDANGKKHYELIEIKPHKQTSINNARSMKDKAAAALNTVKWEAARAFARAHNMKFTILTEKNMFFTGK